MRCGKLLGSTAWLLVVLLLAHSCLLPAYSQAVQKNEEVLLGELEEILERQQRRIEMLEMSLGERKRRIEKLESLLSESESSLVEMEKLLQRQSVIMGEQSRLFKHYEQASGGEVIEAGLLGGFGGALLGFIGGVVGMYYLK